MELLVTALFLLVAFSGWGALLFIELVRRNNCDGQVVLTRKEDGTRVFTLELNMDPNDISGMEYLTFKVEREENHGYDDYPA